jgi:hypothetical protein
MSSFCSDGGQEEIEMIDSGIMEVVEAEGDWVDFFVQEPPCYIEVAHRLVKRAAATDISKGSIIPCAEFERLMIHPEQMRRPRLDCI